MKRFLTFLFLLPFFLQAQFVDEFTDGDISNNPTWQGDVAHFNVNAGFQLQLGAPTGTTDTSIIYTDFVSNFNDTVVWRWKWRLNFSPSDNNNGRVYVMSSAANFNASQGYFLRWGENGSADALKLYKFSNATNTLLITGTTIYATADEITVNLIRYPNGDWVLESDPNAGENFVSEGSATDATYAASNYFGIWCKYTSSNVANFFFDDIQVDSLISDVEPPTVTDVSAISSNILLVKFSEPVNQTTAETTANYSVNLGVGQPTSAVLSSGNDSLVTLTFSGSFTIAQNYQLSISGVKDLAGNTIVSANVTFSYLLFDSPAFRDIVISEIMADPSPVVGLPEAEFIELFNRSSGYFNLSGAKISDASSTVTIPSASSNYLVPNSYVIICDIADTALFASYGQVIGVPSLPALNNGGDDVVLTINNVLIDKVSYLDDWYGDANKAAGGYTLELINPETDCSGLNNWTASNDASGGTPGAQNSVYDTAPDVTAPALISAALTSPTQLLLTFSEPIDSMTILASNLNFDNGLTIDSIIIAEALVNEFSVNFTQALDSATLYKVTVNAISDCEGNTMSAMSKTFGIGSMPKAYDIVFSEIYPAPAEGTQLPNCEYIEIFNRSDKLIRLEGVKISDLSTSATLATVVLEPQHLAVICDDNYSGLFDESITIVEVGSLPSLNNSSDVLTLSLNDVVLDQLEYTDSWYGTVDPCCTSLERINYMLVCSVADQWKPSTSFYGGTPGLWNEVYASSVGYYFNVASVSTTALNQIEVSFSGKLNETEVANASVSINETALTLNSVSGATAVYQAESDFERGSTYTVVIEGFEDCEGVALEPTSRSFYLHKTGDIVINEVLFNPSSTGADFVEWRNVSEHTISIKNWSFGYTSSGVEVFIPLAAGIDSIKSGEHIAFTESPEKVSFDYKVGKLAQTDLPSFGNDTGAVNIHDQFGSQMDWFYYSSKMHFGLIDNPDGVSLERISASAPTNLASNWHSASESVGYATPGYLNSQDQSLIAGSTTISLSSDFVSPDNDGYQDVVAINYHLGDWGYAMAAKVFDAQGNQVRIITSNAILSPEGFITWDGLNDNNEKCALGLHIIYVQLFNLNGSIQEFRLPVVVAGRL